jgi:hypothetical protein
LNIFYFTNCFSKNRFFSLVQAKANENESDRSEHYLGWPIGSSLPGVHSPSDAWSLKKELLSGGAAYGKSFTPLNAVRGPRAAHPVAALGRPIFACFLCFCFSFFLFLLFLFFFSFLLFIIQT